MPRSKFQPQQQFDATQASFVTGYFQGACTAGELIVTHSMASAPKTFIVTPVSSTFLTATVTNTNASGSTVKFWVTGSGHVGSGVVSGSFAAWV
jgi:hypothetical protein